MRSCKVRRSNDVRGLPNVKLDCICPRIKQMLLLGQQIKCFAHVINGVL